MATGVKRIYDGFCGVDFLNEPSIVSLSRSPDALNVWKNYSDSEGICVETRPGLRRVASFGFKINGLYVFGSCVCIVHSGNKLFKWSNFPNNPEAQDLVVLYSDMNNVKSSFNMFKNKLYINDGKHYLVFNGSVVKEVKDEAYVPTTSFSRKPSGGGEKLEDVNLLQPKRRNSFLGDGVSKEYFLDSTSIDSDEVVAVVNNEQLKEGVDFSVDRINGKVIFVSAPSEPALSGSDNVYIVFSKKVQGYEERISRCTKALVFDNRLFFTGNTDFKNTVFCSELNNPAYVSDLNYYEEGSSDSAVTDMTVGNNILWVFKDGDQNNANVFYHMKQLDDEMGKVYPSKRGNVSIGCYACSVNFQDDIVYLSRHGLEGISTDDLDNRQITAHRSSLVDSKMINSDNYKSAVMTEWRGYLLVLVNGFLFLADSRQKYASLSSFEYEWFFWDLSLVHPCVLKAFNDDLYVGAVDGSIFIVDGTNDFGNVINSYWTTPMDNFGFNNQLKTTNKRGGIAKIKTIQNGIVKVARKSNKSDNYKYTTQKTASGFSFASINFGSFSFTTTNKSYIVFKIKEKKINELSLKFYSDEKDKPFGLYSATIEAFAGGYVKK